MPGLSLTERQAQRLWHLEPETCRSLFKALVESGFLRQTPRGGYVRANVG
jgi:DNA-binding IclR family transcriptional regulator